MFSRLNSAHLEKALDLLPAQKAIAIDCLSLDDCNQLIELADQLAYRKARAVTGSQSTPVYQDFELNYAIPDTHPFQQLMATLEAFVEPLLTQKRPADDSGQERLMLNDLIVQRYPPGCAGISPHRDHVEYRLVVLILLLSGNGEFCIHSDRDEARRSVIDFRPGQLLLMGAPGISDDFKRPFHSVRNVTESRRTIGMRYDRRLVFPASTADSKSA